MQIIVAFALSNFENHKITTICAYSKIFFPQEIKKILKIGSSLLMTILIRLFYKNASNISLIQNSKIPYYLSNGLSYEVEITIDRQFSCAQKVFKTGEFTVYSGLLSTATEKPHFSLKDFIS